MPTVPFHNPLVTPDFAQGSRTPRPLGTIGTSYDGRDCEDLTAHFPSAAQVTVITLAGTTATGDITTLTLTPIAGPGGAAWADEIGALSFPVTTGATETVDAVGVLLQAAVLAASKVTSVADVANYNRVADIASVVYVAADNELIITAPTSLIRFTATLTTDGSITSTQASTGNDDDTLKIGVVGVSDGIDARFGRKIKAPVAGTAATAILGVIMDGPYVRPQDAGYAFRDVNRGKDVSFRHFGSCLVYAEAAVTADAQVYVRKTASATEVAGSVNDSATTDTVQITTVTPTAANTTVYRAFIEIKDFFTDAVVATGIVEMTSDADATATEIVTGLKTSLADDNDQLDDYVVGTGTTTLILTVAAGYKMTAPANFGTGPGVLAAAATQAPASDHLIWAGVKFLETTTAAGAAPIYIPR